MGLGFIGIVKQVSRHFSMGYIQIKYFTCRGNFCCLVSELVDEGVPEMMCFAWVEHDRHYFIATIIFLY